MIGGYNLFDRDAHLNEEALALYVDALKLNKVYLLPGAILRHVSDCAECKSEIVEVFSLVDGQGYHLMEGHPYLAKKAGLQVLRVSITYRLAAVLLVGISIGILFSLFRLTNNSRDVLNVSPGTMPVAHPESRKGTAKNDGQISQQKNLADNFSESPNLEDLINSTSRSASLIGISPKNGIMVNRHILFEWKGVELGSVTVKILSNKEKVLKSFKIEGSKFLFAGKLNPGLYYWELESKEELLYVGKFFVK